MIHQLDIVVDKAYNCGQVGRGILNETDDHVRWSTLDFVFEIISTTTTATKKNLFIDYTPRLIRPCVKSK